MNPQLRENFDTLVDDVLAAMPDRVHELLELVPMHVDDRPSPEIMRQMGIRRPEQLCGLYSGVPMDDRSVMAAYEQPSVVHIYREGILAMCTDRRGRIDQRELREQIRITILHELGHYHGLDEDELSQLGYG